MSYLDGIAFGTDQVSGSDHIPLEFNLAEWHDKRQILSSRGEYPPVRGDVTPRRNPIVETSSVKKLIPPAEKFSMPNGVTTVDIQTILIFVLVVIFAMQLRMMYQIEILRYEVEQQRRLK